MKYLVVIILLVASLIGVCQQNIPTGSWRTHYSFNTTISVAQSDQDVFAASKAGLYIVSKAEQSISSITKLNGLSDTGISIIHFNSTTKTLIIAYDNGQLDLMRDNIITSIPDIRLSDIFNSKISYHLYENGIYSFLSTDFGLIQIDTEAQIIKESFLNLSASGDNLKVYASNIYNDSLFLATEDGMITGSLTDNLKDFSSWVRHDQSQGISLESAQVLGLYLDKPITGNKSQGLLTYSNGNWQELNLLGDAIFSNISTANTTLITANNLVYQLKNDGLSLIESNDIIRANNAIADGNTIWVADGQNGLVKISGTTSETIYPNGPFFNTMVNLKSVHNKIIAIPPFKNSIGQPLKNNSGFSVFENGFWTNFNPTGYPKTELTPLFLDISSASQFGNSEIIFSSYGYGLLRWNDNKFEILDETNSPLINSNHPSKNTLVADIDYNNNNLWVLNNSTPTSLHAFNKDETWQSFSPTSNVTNAIEISSTPWGDQWIGIDPLTGGGIVVYGSEGDQIILKKNGLGTIPSNSINQLLLDKEDKIWVATSKGVVFFLFPFSIIEDPTQEAIVPIIDSELLFSNENVNCLAVDGGNRIWMGTNEGAWLFDNDGSVLINHFNIENSPILSNVITNIAIDNISGEVFFSTDKGLISYRGTATIVGTYETPKIFPNPVSPNFTGVVTLEGVPTNGELKITDSAGSLVATLSANGNTAIWDLKNSQYNMVATGVYFVFLSSKDGGETQFGKIAVIR